jgi:L-aspartate oxidase
VDLIALSKFGGPDYCVGAYVLDERGGKIETILARATVLATGGSGKVYLYTTNPDVATGDGVAMAYRAGAEIRDIEFVQFHPTALRVEGAPRFLLSEALRGEGGILRNAAGERFTDELAPRDVVTRAIVAELKRTGAPHVFLDLTHRGADFIRRRFPRVYETCARYGVDISTQPAPVHPAAHYAMGGVGADLDGRTTIPRLFAAGEVACTGVHGANRLASNSLLEGLVFGARAGAAMRDAPPSRADGCAPPIEFPEAAEAEVRALAWEKCGIIRSGEELASARDELRRHARRSGAGAPLAAYELRNIHAVALLIAECALAREESRGAHYRVDFPFPRKEFEFHSRASLRKAVKIEFQPHETENPLDHGDLRSP